MSYIGTEPKDIRSFGRTKFDYTATQGQTAFTGADDDGKVLAFTTGQIEVYVNGILMDDSDFTTTGTGTVTLASAANLNDVVNVVSFETNIPDSNYVPASGGTFTGAVTAANGLTVDDDGATPLTVDRATSDGTIIDLQKDGTSVGTIGTDSNGDFVIDGSANHSGLRFKDNTIVPKQNGSDADNAIDLGKDDKRWKDLYLSGTVNANKLSTTSNTLDISVDDDGSGSDQQIRFLEGGVVRMVLEDNDLYVHDNINAGRKYESGGSNITYETGSSAVLSYSADAADGSGEVFRTFIQSYNSSDPDIPVFQAHTRDVMDDTGVTTESQKSSAITLDNGGRVFTWSSHYAGRTRPGTTATTTAYRAGDNSFVAYSGTGNSHGATTAAGYTIITGRESSNSDICFEIYHSAQRKIKFLANGNGYFDGGADVGNADYAEYFEWADGNSGNEDRRGYPVVLTTDGKIRIATSEDDASDFIGIVSVEAAIVGDSAWAAWTGKYERDRFGQKVYEDYDLLCWGPYDEESKSYKTQTTRQVMIDAGREADIPEDAITVTKQRQKLSADYDPNREYIARKDRQEWQAIGLMGKLPLLKGQPTSPNWKKLFDLNDEVEMWLVR